MDLFIVNRYFGDNESEKTGNDQENDHLAQLLSKIEERKSKKEEKVASVKRSVHSNTLIPELQQGHIDNVPLKKKQKKKKQVNDVEKEASALDVLEQNNEDLKSENKLCDPNEEVSTHANGFTVLGVDQFHKKTKVKRVLPYWLANPSIVSVNLQELNTTVDDIPGLDEDIVQRLKENGITYLFPVQSQVIPWLLSAHSKPAQYWPCDVCVSAPTGSGKTLAFVVPIVQALKNRVVCHVRALIVLPVQDLAVQVFKVFQNYCAGTGLKVVLITGQSSFLKEQSQLVRTSTVSEPYSLVDIVVTTPGRLVDHLQSTVGFSLKYLRFLVIDEADRVMESVQNDWLYHVDKHINAGSRPFLTVASLETVSPPPQKLLFSATLSQDPEKLQQLGLFQPKLFTSVVGDQIRANGTFADGDCLRGDFIGKYTTPAELSEKFCMTSLSSKPLVLYHLIISNQWQHILCFAGSQQAAHRLCLLLSHLGHGQLRVAEISSACKRLDRDKVLHKFAGGEIDVLVSSDALARGMDIPGVDYVVSYDPPKNVKTYIHRIGRTGRAGRQGTAITLLLSNQSNHFQQMLHTADKSTVVELTVSESEVESLEEQYKSALEALKQDLQKERAESSRKLMTLKSVGAFNKTQLNFSKGRVKIRKLKRENKKLET